MKHESGKNPGLLRLKALGITVILGLILGTQAGWAMENPDQGPLLKDSSWDRWKSWQLAAQSGYAFAGPMNGWGLGAGAHWFPIRYLGLGASVDSARIRVEGRDPKFIYGDDGAYAFGLRSTFLGAGLMGRLPIHRFSLFAKIDLGRVWTTTVETKNVACSFQGGTTFAAALGLQYLVHRRINVGLDWRARGHSIAELCTTGMEGASLPFDPLQQVNLSLAYRFID